MHTYQATIAWKRGGQSFSDNRYSRAHEWTFDGGARVPASSSPLSVPVPMSDPAAVDPEEALVAAASSCHMLWFLSIAARRGYVVDQYTDRASAVMDKRSDGKVAITRIALRPDIAFSGDSRPDAGQLEAMHHEAHERCFIANTLNCEVAVEPV